MNKFAIALSITLGTLFSAPAFAAYVCKWTAQGTDSNFANDAIYSKKPRIEKEGCGGATTAPTCTGYLYCAESNAGGRAVPPQAGLASCESIKVEGNWRCPDAQTCAEDPNVMVINLARAPSKVQAPTPGQDGGGMREGVGGR